MRAIVPLVLALLLSTGLVGGIPASSAQGQPPPGPAAQAPAPDPQEFVRLAYSSASLQAQASQLAATRDTRPEVKSFATAAANFRTSHLQRIEAFARERGLTLPSVKNFEHQVILENLQPLDFLALSRRYAEVEVQALEQEIGIYRVAARSSQEDMKAFASQYMVELQQQLEAARKMHSDIGP